MSNRLILSNPEVDHIIAEMDALNTALRAMVDPEEVQKVKPLVQVAYRNRRPVESIDDYVIGVSMAKIIGEQITENPPRPPAITPWHTYVAETVGLAWVAWALGKPGDAERAIAELHMRKEYKQADYTNMIHLYALYNWAAAVEGLAVGLQSEAARFYKRAAEIGSSFGTESHPVVLWTMAASLLPST